MKGKLTFYLQRVTATSSFNRRGACVCGIFACICGSIRGGDLLSLDHLASGDIAELDTCPICFE
jgi:hypothetical protein